MTRKNGSYIFKRIFSVILTLAFSLTALPVWTGAAETVSAYAAEEQTGVEYNGQEGPGVYTISTPEQLEMLAEKVNDGVDYAGSTFKLVDDIDLSEKYNKDSNETWVPIGGGQKHPFSGTFDGGKESGYQITLYMDVDEDLVSRYGVWYGFIYPCFGLFGYVNGVIQNLRVEGDISTEGVAGKDALGNHVGGIVGYNIGTVKECEYDGTITTGYEVESIGGIVGYNGEGSTIENCTNNGDIEITDADSRMPSRRIGGIVGTNNGRVVECRNTGSITSEIKEASYKIQMREIGGIVGGIVDESTIDSCTNDGDIKITKITADREISVSGIGGIAGGVSSEIKNCHNTGNITVEFEGEGESANIGGISGSINDWGDDFIKVTGCTNTGEIKADNGKYVGGISGSLGMAGMSGTMTDCINQGTVQGSKNIGGIVGHMKNAEVIKCYNIGAVSGNDDTGGVVGSMENAEVIKCYNIGTVSGNNDAGGVVGYLDDENVTVQSCYYLDTCGAVGEGTSATGTQFNSGEIAYLLQEDQSGQVWGQQLSGSKNSYPIFTDKSEEKVLKVIFYIDDTEYDTGYANPDGAVEIFPDDPERDGYLFCKWTADGKINGDELANHVRADGDKVYATWRYTAPDEVKTEVTETTVTITSPVGSDYEYSLDDSDEWQDSPEFDGLTPGSEHTVHVRRKGTDEIAPSESADVTVTTDRSADDSSGGSSQQPSTGDNTGGDNNGDDNKGGDNNSDDNNGSTSQQPSTGTTPPSTGDNTSSTGDSTEPSDENGAGNITVNSESGENAPSVSMDEETSNKLKEEIIAEHLTPEEKAAVANGDTLDIILQVENAGDSVPAADRQATEAVLTDTEYNIGMYLNVDLIKLINGQQVEKITELNTPIRVTIEIPEELRSTHRAFAIVRVHNGVAEILEDVDSDPDTITIVTDKFSTYSIAYQDAEVSNSDDDYSDDVNSDDTNSNDPTSHNPNTGLATPIAVAAIALVITVTAVTVKKKKLI